MRRMLAALFITVLSFVTISAQTNDDRLEPDAAKDS